jgi:hypothetical protein
MRTCTLSPWRWHTFVTVATIVDDGELTIFVPTTKTTSKFQDRGITTAMQLTRWDDKVIYIQDGNVWRVRTK